jgi:hypothetical protein
MNLRAFMVLGAISAISLGACVITGTGSSGSDNSGGVGGIGGEGGAPSGGVGGAGGSGATCDPEYSCALAITPPDGDPTLICDDDTESADAYDAYAECVCSGACAIDCGDTDRCKVGGGSSAGACTDCIQDTNAGCGKEQQACNNDA